MTAQLIPTDNTPFYSQITALEGASFLLTFSYNQRCDCWYLSVAMPDGSGDIVNGLKILTNWPLLRQCADPRLPPGEIFCFTNTTDLSPPRFADLLPSGRSVLVYLPSTDLP
jgi:hypothetical protein